MDVTEGVLTAAFAAGGVEVRAAVPAHALRRGDRALRHRPARHCASAWRSATSATRCARRSSRSSAACSTSGGVVRGINAGAHELSRAELDGLIEFAQGQGAGGLVWAYVEEGGGWRSPVAKFLSDDERAAIAAALDAAPGDLLLLVADDAGVAAQTLGALRLELAARFGLVAGGRLEAPVGDRLPAARVERRRGALGCAAPSVHRRRPRSRSSCSSATRRPRGRAPTTSS